MHLSNTLRLSSLTLIALAAGARAERIYGISTVSGYSGASLVSFDSAAPSSFTTVGALSGVAAGMGVRAIDFRPADGTLYALATSTATHLGQLYTVNLGTGALSAVGSTFALDTGNSTRVSMDFNPVSDRIRVVAGTGINLRLNPNDGTLVGTDATLAYAAGDINELETPLVSDVAYTNNVVGAATTTLYGYDFNLDTIATIGTAGGVQSPDTGLMHTVGRTDGVGTGGRDTGGPSAYDTGMGFDISGATGIGYISMDETDSPTAFEEIYTVDLATGALTLVQGEIGVNLLDISVAVKPVPEPATVAALGLGALAFVRRRRAA